MKQHGSGVGVAPSSAAIARSGSSSNSGVRAEQRFDAAGVNGVEAGLGTLEHGGEAIAPGDVEPGRAGVLVSAVLSPAPMDSST